MGSKIEEVKKILRRLNSDGRYSDAVLTIDAKDICQLFEEQAVREERKAIGTKLSELRVAERWAVEESHSFTLSQREKKKVSNFILALMRGEMPKE